MDRSIAVLAGVGAWLLFAGPLLQAALELRDESAQHDDLHPRSATPQDAVSPWWWLLPPVAIQRHLALRRRFRKQQLASMGEEEVRQNLLFSNRATGWLLVASGALLIAVKETWQAGAELGWPEHIRVIVILGVAVLTTGAAAAHTASTGRVLRHGGPGGGRRGALRAAAARNVSGPAPRSSGAGASASDD